MPLGLDPNARTKICLESDEARPPEQRVYFLCRFITCRQREEWHNKMEDAMREGISDADHERLTMEALAIGVIGPVDVKDVPCTLEGLKAVLTMAELWELARVYPRRIAMSELDKKKSELESRRSTASSAKETAA